MTVRETFELDWTPALRGADTLDRALAQAAGRFHTAIANALSQLDATVQVTADAKAVTGAIDGAVEDANTAVEVTGEAAPVTGAIDAAVENANTNVEITGDASQVTGAINAAVQNAQAGTKGLSTNLGEAGASAGLLATGLTASAGALAGIAAGAVSAAAVGKFLHDSINAASDLNESFNKANVVFGDSIDLIEEFAQTSATSVGLSKQAAFEALGTFGNLFNALGSTRSEAAKMSTTTVQLAADLASFNNIGVDEALERLRSGLVGEIEPLRRLGISFNAAQVEAKAAALGLADANGQISEGAKVQARLALILEQSSNANGDFARTSTGLANQQRIVTAQFKDLEAEIGKALLPVVSDLLSTAQDLIPVLEGVGKAIGIVAKAADIGLKPVGLFIDALSSTPENVASLETALDKIVRRTKDAGYVTPAAARAFRELAAAADSGTFFGDKYASSLDLFRRIAKDNVPVAEQLRNVLRATGTDVSDIDKIISKANKSLEAQQQAAEGDTKAIKDLGASIDELVDAQLALDKSLLDLEKAQTDYNDALKNGDPTEIRKAFNDYEQAIVDWSRRARDAATVQSGFTNETEKAIDGVDAQIRALQGLRNQVSGPMQQAIDTYVAGLEKTRGTFIATLEVDPNFDPINNALDALFQRLDALRNGTIPIFGGISSNFGDFLSGLSSRTQGGGFVTAGSLLQVNEGGPNSIELFRPAVNGTVIPLGLSESGSGQSVDQSVHIGTIVAPPGASPERTAQLMVRKLRAAAFLGGR